MSDLRLHRLSRRVLLASAATYTGRTLISPSVFAQEVSSVSATTLGKIRLYLKSQASGKPIATIPGSTTVRVLAGPDPSGWYLVDLGAGSSVNPGWTSGEGLTFSQRANILWDAGVFTGATDAAGWVGSLRHNFVVTIAGPDTNGFTFVRSGNLAGYTYTSALKSTEMPLTDTTAEWWADANRSTLEVKLMVGADVVDTFPSSMSSETGDGFLSTAVGTWWVYEKVEGLQFTPYANAWFMYWCGFDPSRFNGFHSWTMDGNGYVLNGGWGNTAGCIATEPKHALIIYRFLNLNSRVEIHW